MMCISEEYACSVRVQLDFSKVVQSVSDCAEPWVEDLNAVLFGQSSM